VIVDVDLSFDPQALRLTATYDVDPIVYLVDLNGGVKVHVQVNTPRPGPVTNQSDGDVDFSPS
jgi:hypothetical protein